jgi:hypothetical protein
MGRTHKSLDGVINFIKCNLSLISKQVDFVNTFPKAKYSSASESYMMSSRGTEAWLCAALASGNETAAEIDSIIQLRPRFPEILSRWFHYGEDTFNYYDTSSTLL